MFEARLTWKSGGIVRNSIQQIREEKDAEGKEEETNLDEIQEVPVSWMEECYRNTGEKQFCQQKGQKHCGPTCLLTLLEDGYRQTMELCALSAGPLQSTESSV